MDDYVYFFNFTIINDKVVSTNLQCYDEYIILYQVINGKICTADCIPSIKYLNVLFIVDKIKLIGE